MLVPLSRYTVQTYLLGTSEYRPSITFVSTRHGQASRSIAGSASVKHRRRRCDDPARRRPDLRTKVKSNEPKTNTKRHLAAVTMGLRGPVRGSLDGARVRTSVSVSQHGHEDTVSGLIPRLELAVSAFYTLLSMLTLTLHRAEHRHENAPSVFTPTVPGDVRTSILVHGSHLASESQ